MKCAECGFLSVRRRHDGELISMPSEIRADFRRMPTEYVPGAFDRNQPQPIYLDRPLCAAAARSFPRSTEDLSYSMMFEQEIDCGAFTKWFPALSPSEHQQLDFQNRLLLREDRRDAEMRQREDDRYLEMQNREDLRDARVEARQTRQHWTEIIVFGVLIGVLTIIGSMIDAGWFGDPFHSDEPERVVVVTPTVQPAATLEAPPQINQPTLAPSLGETPDSGVKNP